MANTEFELVIRQGKRPLWQIVLSGIFFTLMLYALYESVMPLFNHSSEQNFIHFSKSLYDVALLFTLGVYNAMETDILIDTDKDLLITRYRVGPFIADRKSQVPVLEYVAVFRQEDNYEVNLWYKGNRHYKMYRFDNSEDAFSLARQVAARLNLDILDSTRRGDNQWIEKPVADA